MRTTRMHRRMSLALAASLATVTLAACGGDDGGDAGDDGSTAAGGDTDCSAFEQYGDLEGLSVSVYTSIISPEDQPHIDSYIPFEECTGATVEYEGSREFEAQLLVRLESGNAPDIAYVPQPGLIERMAADFPDQITEVGELAQENVDNYYNEAWRGYGSVDDTLYGAPLGANAKSFVWYSPAAFEENGYEIPETWDDLLALSDQIASDHPDSKPWCAGIESGGATGWPATDWVEDVMLRTAGPDVYDQWVNHEIPFDDPQVVEAVDAVGEILRNPDYVNGGLGEVQSIATTPFGEAGLPILDGSCFLHRQASFYQANWPEGTTVAEDGACVRLLPARAERRGPPRPGRGRVHRRAGRPARGRGAAGLPDQPRVVEREGQGHRPRLGVGQLRARPGQPGVGDRPARLRAAHRRGGGLPLRRLRPHAGRGRCRHLLVGDDRLDRQRQGHAGGAHGHRELLARRVMNRRP
ncbi:ABC transporter substrate-binding protein [Ornithinimicrobium sp. W1665]|uniref:ABC transporter substrate-binding protein n=1 Tax=Ornithinimicrobium sp. W1665 TaxID=3416666 RepID=UPI003D6B527D